MKWDNKGKQEYRYSCIIKKIQENNKIIVYGAGRLGQRIGDILERYNLLGGYIDNDVEKQKEKIHGHDVISENSFLNNYDGSFIVVAVAYAEVNKKIIKSLSDRGLTLGKEYMIFPEFLERALPEIVLAICDKTLCDFVQMCVTERCTLKCVKCAHACYAVKKDSEDMSVEQIKYSVDCLFSRFDYINQFVLIGGEPLLYRNLTDIIRYVGENYRNQINRFAITTNGTIIPSEEVLEVCREYKLFFDISNYSNAIPNLKKQYEKMCSVLEQNSIQYSLASPDREWYDYGFEYVDHGNDENKITLVFDNCNTACHEIRENRFYYCVMARSVSENLHMRIGHDDYLDLEKLDGVYWKKELIEYTQGYSEKGYLDMCNYCNGADCMKHIVPPAEQLE